MIHKVSSSVSSRMYDKRTAFMVYRERAYAYCAYFRNRLLDNNWMIADGVSSHPLLMLQSSSSSSSSARAALDDPRPIKCPPSSIVSVRLMLENTIHEGVIILIVFVIVGWDVNELEELADCENELAEAKRA